MTLLIVDDHPIVLQGICALLSSSFVDAEILTACCAEEAGKMIACHEVDCMIADLELGGASGTTLIQQVRQLRPATQVIVYTMHEEPWSVSRIADLDTEAVVLKSDSPDELLHAVRNILQGKGYYSRSFLRLLASLQRFPDRLSDREMQVIELTAQGLSATETAQRLGVCTNTIEFHRRRIMQKLGAANAADMVRRAMDLGWKARI